MLPCQRIDSRVRLSQWLVLTIGLAAVMPVLAQVDVMAPLAAAGDAKRGRALLLARESANCILCHGLSDPGVRFSGNLAPPLDGVGARLAPAQLRARIADSSRINPQTIMPPYFRTEGLTEVAAQYRGKTVLAAQEVEDIVAYLAGLK